MDISFPMDIFLYGHYSIWTFYLMDNLQIHRIQTAEALLPPPPIFLDLPTALELKGLKTAPAAGKQT